MTAIRSPIRPALRAAIRSPLQARMGGSGTAPPPGPPALLRTGTSGYILLANGGRILLRDAAGTLTFSDPRNSGYALSAVGTGGF